MQTIAVLAAILASAATVTAQEATCHNYVLVATRGTYELQGKSIAFPGMINSTLVAIAGGIEYDTVYPASANQTAYLGADDIVRFINLGLKYCPAQKYALLGYSQGASATELALKNYSDPTSAGYNAIRAVLVVGDPYHKPNQTVNVDENGGSATSSYPGVLYSATNPNDMGFPDIWYTNGKLLDICYTQDAICAPGYPNATFIPGHLRYGDEVVQEQGAKFLIGKLSSNGTTNGTHTNSTASATPPTTVAPIPGPTGSTSAVPTSGAPAMVANGVLALIVGAGVLAMSSIGV